jgi:hypothetical protein
MYDKILSTFLVALIDEKDRWRESAISIQKVLKKKKNLKW